MTCSNTRLRPTTEGIDMNDMEMAQLVVDIAWDIVNRVDNDAVTARGAIHRINWTSPDPRFEFTATGLMLKIDRLQPYLYDLLTPWGVLQVTDYSYFSAEAILAMLKDYAAEEVSEDDRAYRNIHWGNCSWQSRLYSIRRFGDVELPTAIGAAGLGTDYAAEYPLVLRTYPEDYKPYWDMVHRWQVLYSQLERGWRHYQELGLEQYRASYA